jgi:transcription initiation factor IIE alpha subunit
MKRLVGYASRRDVSDASERRSELINARKRKRRLKEQMRKKDRGSSFRL